ncbi:MAG: proteasome accessory factor PafA2 [Acidobacteria bacterium]|nr:MAG: proteasome accessory factor PafA2 [Acidobacteriota bacterium]
MAITKVFGTETEFGISMRGVAEFNPVIGSSLLVNGYAAVHLPPVNWDFEDEHPEKDARGYLPFAMAPEVETTLANVVLTNGARFYVDHAHPEYSTPECVTLQDLVTHDTAGTLILQRAMAAAEALMPEEREFLVHKNNSDGKGNSYGCHENYLMAREVPFRRIAEVLIPFFVTRQVFAGSGKVGSEHGAPEVAYQISQRADFFEEEIGLETTLKRPIINTRDESHADPERFRRLHVIVGDANMCEMPTYLKVGTTALILDLIEDDFIDKDLAIESPVAAMQIVSHDITCKTLLRRPDGSTVTPVQVQWEYLELARKWAEGQVPDPEREKLMSEWERILTQLEIDPLGLGEDLDWVAKYKMLEGYKDRHGIGWSDPKMRLIDLQYHDLRPERGLYFKLLSQGRVARLTSPDAVEEAVRHPPENTRAYFRGRCIERFAGSIAAANWDSMVFDLGEDPLRRVPMMDPLRGTKTHVGDLIDSCDSAAELLDEIAS